MAVKIKPGIYELEAFPLDLDYCPLVVNENGDWFEYDMDEKEYYAIAYDLKDDYISDYGPLKELSDEELDKYNLRNV